MGRGLHQTLGAVQKAHHRLPFKEVYPSNFFVPRLAAPHLAIGSIVHGLYGITRGLTLSLDQAVKMDEALLTGSGVGHGTPGFGEENFFHLPGYPV